MDVSKSVALVTGGAQGIGKEIVLQLLKEGAKVSIVDIKDKEGKELEQYCQQTYGPDHVKFMRCDVSNSQQLFDAFDHTKSAFGSLDIVCNNAGIITFNPNESRKIININLTAVVEGTFKAIEMMSTKNNGKGGVVVNMSSAAGLVIGPGMPALYTATKTGVVAFSRSLNEYAKEGVRVNCICPTFADTNLVKFAMESQPDLKEKIPEFGFVEISDIVKAVMRCVNEGDMVGNVIAVLRNNVIRDVEFQETPLS